MEKSTRPDIAHDVHQCARFMSDSKESREIGRYLLPTAAKGIILCPKDNPLSATPMLISQGIETQQEAAIMDKCFEFKAWQGLTMQL